MLIFTRGAKAVRSKWKITSHLRSNSARGICACALSARDSNWAVDRRIIIIRDFVCLLTTASKLSEINHVRGSDTYI